MEVKEEKTVAFVTLGCKVNQYETNAMAQNMQENGYKIVELDENPNIVIVNTCTVTNMSDRKSRKILKSVKQHNKDTLVVAVGCYAQVAKTELEKIQEIDLVLGNNEKKQVNQYIEEFLIKKDNYKNSEIQDIMQSKEFCEFGDVTYTEKTRAVIKIQDGCDRYCSYCIIPYARGRVRSRNKENIISEIEKIVKTGIKEVVLTGIHIASYGKDLKQDYELIDLIEEIDKIQNLERIRLGSIEPLWINKEKIERMKKVNKLCHHFHLSLQSGCNKTLKEMNRRYTIEEFEEIVNQLRKNFEDVILTTDIIVGFPNETEEDFNETYKFLERIRFYKMHIFKYSPRKGTKASVMKNQIEGNEKERRSNRLLELSEKNQEEYNKQYIGKQVEVLFEEEKDGIYQGHTANYILVHYKSEENIENKIVKVKCKEIDKDYIIA